MNSKILMVSVILSISSLVGCASGPTFAEIEDRIPPVPSGNGRIYFYRSGSPVGSAVQPSIFLNGVAVGDSKPGGFFFIDEAPGSCVVTCATEAERNATFQLSAGETRYVRTSISMGFFVGRVTPELVPPSQGMQEIRNKSYTGTDPLLTE